MTTKKECSNNSQLRLRADCRARIAKLKYERIRDILTGDAEVVLVVLEEVCGAVAEIISEDLFEFQPEYQEHAFFLHNYAAKIFKTNTQPEHIYSVVDALLLILIQGLNNLLPF